MNRVKKKKTTTNRLEADFDNYTDSAPGYYFMLYLSSLKSKHPNLLVSIVTTQVAVFFPPNRGENSPPFFFSLLKKVPYLKK